MQAGARNQTLTQSDVSSSRRRLIPLKYLRILFLYFMCALVATLVPLNPTTTTTTTTTTTSKMLADAANVDYCYSDIGCFPLSAEFYHPRHRPFNVRPLHRRHIRTQFELFNRAHPEGFMLLPWDKYNLRQSRFDPRLETKIIIPGWLDNINRALWVRKLKDALLWLWAPANIIVLRWTNFTPYTVATANTRVVGAELANLMKFLERELNYDPAYYHIIGHSLGAHIAGYAGDRVPGLGRITALDPARPFFQDMPKSVRLDRGDAKFVDAIHSDFTPENAIFLIMSYGMTTPVGHLDFYPNGPPLFQPGCTRDTLLSVQTGIAKGLRANSLSVAFLESVRYLTACDHQRSHEWFIESVTNRECAFVGVRCNEFEGMINGRCTCDDSPSACAIMGIHADQMYLNNVHEELWPVRAGSIDYKWKSKVRARPPPPPVDHLPTGEDYDDATSARAQSYQDYYAMMMQAAGAAKPPPVGLPIDIEHLGNSADYNYNLLAQSAALGAAAPHLGAATKDEIYAQLKQQLEQAHAQASILSVPYHQQRPRSAEPPAAKQKKKKRPLVYTDEAESQEAASSGAAAAAATGEDAAGASSPEVAPSVVTYDDEQAEASEQVAATLLGLDGADSILALTQQQHDQEAAALNDDLAFAEYLRAHLLGAASGLVAQDDSQRASSKHSARNESSLSAPASSADDDVTTSSHSNKTEQIESSRGDGLGTNSIEQADGAAATLERRDGKFDGHPALLSSMKRDIETWYEDNARWHLKTNNRPQYCSNQYQLLIYLGALRTASGRDRLRANLLVSIIGTRGQLLNQRFIPRGSTLTSFTMQPFFILLEGSYSLGQIRSVALSWEARRDPDPVKATITFQSSLVQQLGQRVPAYKAKQFPWLPEETEYDYTQGFSRAPRHERVHSELLARAPLRVHHQIRGSETRPRVRFPLRSAASELLKSNIAGHYAHSYGAPPTSKRRADHSVARRSCSRSNSPGTARPCGSKAGSGARSRKLAPIKVSNSRLLSKRSDELSDESDTPEADPGEEQPAQEQLRERQLLEHLLALKQAEQRDLLEASRLVALQQQQQVASSHYAPNQTYVMPASHAQLEGASLASERDPESPYEEKAPDMSLTPSESYFVPLIDPPSEPSMYVPPPGSRLPAEALEDHEGEVTLDLHNIDLSQHSGRAIEDSIVINQVVVSPLQATYGRHGRSAKTFCPPASPRKQMLVRDQTIQLTPTFMTRCSQHHRYLGASLKQYHAPPAAPVPVYAS